MSANTIKITKEEILAVLDNDQEPVSTGNWRWGKTHSYIIKKDNKNYMFTVAFHVEEGVQIDGDETGYEVEPFEVKTIKWRTVK
jgi:hypothetical protein